jgi:hypothetical protein
MMAGAAGEPSETGPYTRPDAPPPEAADDAPSGPRQRGRAADGARGAVDPDRSDDAGASDAPPVATSGSEATRTVTRGTARETGEAIEHRGDAVDGSEGSATGSRTDR